MRGLLRGTRLASLFLLGACSPPASPASPPALVWARGADSSTLDPAEVEWGEDIKVARSLYESLVSFKEGSLELEGRLATSWTVSADGKTVTFELRPGVTFHDGTPFDAETVVFSVQRLLDPRHPQRPRAAPHASNLRDVQKVAADGPLRVVFTLHGPSNVFLQALATVTAGIVSPPAVKKHGESFGLHPAGTGPLRLSRWERGVKIELEPFAGYWGEKPPHRVLVVPVASPQTAVEKLRKGEVHVVDHPDLGDVRALEAGPDTRIAVQPPVNVCCLGFNLRKPPYDDLELRRAVSLAIDRKALIEVAYHGFAEPAANVAPPLVWGDIGPAPPYEHDAARARAIVERLPAASRKLELIHVTIPRPYMPEPQRLAETLKDQLVKVGFAVSLKAFDKDAYGLKTRDPGHPMFVLGWHADFPDPDNYLYPLLHGDNAGDLSGSFFKDEAFDRAVTSARGERDSARRRDLYREAYGRYRELLPTIPLVHVRQIVALSRRVDYPMHPLEPRLHTARLRQP